MQIIGVLFIVLGFAALLAMLQILYFCICKSHIIRYTDFVIVPLNNKKWFFVRHTYGMVLGFIRYRGLLYCYNDPNQVYIAESEQEADNYCNDILTRYNLGELK